MTVFFFFSFLKKHNSIPIYEQNVEYSYLYAHALFDARDLDLLINHFQRFVVFLPRETKKSSR